MNLNFFMKNLSDIRIPLANELFTALITKTYQESGSVTFF